MKVIFLDNNQDNKEYETEGHDLRQIFQIAYTLSDKELKILETVIKKFPEVICDKKYD